METTVDSNVDYFIVSNHNDYTVFTWTPFELSFFFPHGELSVMQAHIMHFSTASTRSITTIIILSII